MDDSRSRDSWERADLVPRPDPTKLTTEAVERATLQYRRELAQLQELLDIRIANLASLLDERYATQTKALDAAFVAAEKAVATALASAEKAVAKAEVANEIRFQGVNEFRKTLSDQSATFLSRTEYTTAHQALEDKLTLANDRMGALELRLTSRLDLNAGTAAGTQESAYTARENINTRLLILGVVVTVVVIVVNIVIAIVLK